MDFTPSKLEILTFKYIVLLVFLRVISGLLGDRRYRLSLMRSIGFREVTVRSPGGLRCLCFLASLNEPMRTMSATGL